MDLEVAQGLADLSLLQRQPMIHHPQRKSPPLYPLLAPLQNQLHPLLQQQQQQEML